jgi:hypothetical protein
MSDEPSSRRRVSPRLHKHFVIRYRKLPEGAWRVSTLRDISQRGARFFCEEPFSPNAMLLVEMGMPVFETPIQVPVRVVWCKSATGSRIAVAEHGVEFSADAPVAALIAVALEKFANEGKADA